MRGYGVVIIKRTMERAGALGRGMGDEGGGGVPGLLVGNGPLLHVRAAPGVPAAFTMFCAIMFVFLTSRPLGIGGAPYLGGSAGSTELSVGSRPPSKTSGALLIASSKSFSRAAIAVSWSPTRRSASVRPSGVR